MMFNFDKKIDILNEGGNAIKSSEPIRGDLALPIANQVIKLLKKKYPNIKYAPIGSTGKKDSSMTSGDIDIAVELDFNESTNVLEYLESKIDNLDYNLLKGFKILSFGYPYNEDGKKQKKVQVDLMFFPNIELAKYFYYSPDYIKKQSKFKGSVRNLLMISILKNIDVKEHPNTLFSNGNPKDVWKYTIKPEKGLVLLHQTFLGKKGQEIKSKRTVEKDTEIINQDTNQITKFMMGKDADSDTISSFEKMVEWMNSDKFPYKEKNQQIYMDLIDYIDHQMPQERESVISCIKSSQNAKNEALRRDIRPLTQVINESLVNRIKYTKKFKDDEIDSNIFGLEKILKKILIKMSEDEDEYQKFLWLPLPSEGKIRDEETFNIKGEYPMCLLLFNDYGEKRWEDCDLLVRFAEDNPYAEVDASGDVFFGDLTNGQKIKLRHLVELELDTPFERLEKDAEVVLDLFESVFKKVKNAKKSEFDGVADKQVMNLTPQMFRDIVVKNVLTPLGLEEGDSDEGDFYWEERPMYR